MNEVCNFVGGGSSNVSSEDGWGFGITGWSDGIDGWEDL